jgi:hypothetical protein
MELLNLQALRADVRWRDLIQPPASEVDNAVAVQADEMVMLTNLWIKADGSAGAAHLGDYADANEPLAIEIDGRPGHASDPGPDEFSDLICCGPILPVKSSFQDRPPLHRQWETAMMAQLLEVLMPRLLFFCSHNRLPR